jgi:hypothetical protein
MYIYIYIHIYIFTTFLPHFSVCYTPYIIHLKMVYNCVIETNLMHYSSSVYFVNQPLHTCFGHICSPSSGGVLYIFNNWYELCFTVYCLLTGQQTVNWKHNMLYIYSIPPDDGLQICPKHVEVDWQYKLSIHVASSWFLLHKCKDKAIPLQAWAGSEASRRLRLPDFKTVGTRRCYGCQPCVPTAFTPRKHTFYSFLLEAELIPGP